LENTMKKHVPRKGPKHKNAPRRDTRQAEADALRAQAREDERQNMPTIRTRGVGLFGRAVAGMMMAVSATRMLGARR
jgi:hypothetical protein